MSRSKGILIVGGEVNQPLSYDSFGVEGHSPRFYHSLPWEISASILGNVGVGNQLPGALPLGVLYYEFLRNMEAPYRSRLNRIQNAIRHNWFTPLATKSLDA